jgi:hypothetical protein
VEVPVLPSKHDVADDGKTNENDEKDDCEVVEIDGGCGQGLVDNLEARLELIKLEKAEDAQQTIDKVDLRLASFMEVRPGSVCRA